METSRMNGTIDVVVRALLWCGFVLGCRHKRCSVRELFTKRRHPDPQRAGAPPWRCGGKSNWSGGLCLRTGPASSRLVLLLHLGLNVVLERKVDMILESHKP